MSQPNMPRDGSADSMQVLRPGTSQTVPFTDTSSTATPVALATSTRVVRISGDVDVHYAATGTVTTVDPFLMAGAYEYFAVASGDLPEFLAPGGAGSINITEMS